MTDSAEKCESFHRRRQRLRKAFSIGSSRARSAAICAVPEVEIWRQLLLMGELLAGDLYLWKKFGDI